jgi:hypothetical protein
LDWTPAGVYPDENRGRRDEFEAWSLFVIPAPYQVRGKLQPESSDIKEEFDVYKNGLISNSKLNLSVLLERAYA